MIQAFLDESGIHDGSKACVIAGYYGHSGAWRKLDGRWRKILRDAKVPFDKFHALDLIEHRKFFFQMPRDERDKLKADLARAVASFGVYIPGYGCAHCGRFPHPHGPTETILYGGDHKRPHQTGEAQHKWVSDNSILHAIPALRQKGVRQRAEQGG